MPQDPLEHIKLAERFFWCLGLGIGGMVFDSREEFERAVDKNKLSAESEIERKIVAWEVESKWRDAELFVRYGHVIKIEMGDGFLPWPRFIAYNCNLCNKVIGGMPGIMPPGKGMKFLEYYCVNCGAYIGGH